MWWAVWWAVAAAVVAVVAILAFGVFGVQRLFIDDTVNEAEPVFASGATVSPTLAAPTTVPPAAAAPTTAAAVPATAAPAVRVEAQGSFISREHDTSGTASILTDGSERVLRLADFATSNGPDLHVYLSAGVTASGPDGAFDDDFVELGRLKGNIGDQNYAVPAGVDPRYRTVVIWCDRFNAVFGAADLA